MPEPSEVTASGGVFIVSRFPFFVNCCFFGDDSGCSAALCVVSSSVVCLLFSFVGLIDSLCLVLGFSLWVKYGNKWYFVTAACRTLRG